MCHTSGYIMFSAFSHGSCITKADWSLTNLPRLAVFVNIFSSLQMILAVTCFLCSVLRTMVRTRKAKDDEAVLPTKCNEYWHITFFSWETVNNHINWKLETPFGLRHETKLLGFRITDNMGQTLQWCFGESVQKHSRTHSCLCIPFIQTTFKLEIWKKTWPRVSEASSSLTNQKLGVYDKPGKRFQFRSKATSFLLKITAFTFIKWKFIKKWA